MKNQKNTLRRTACMLCAVIVAALLSASALAEGLCYYRDPITDVVCGKSTTRTVLRTTGLCSGYHSYYSESLGSIARCDYKYRTTVEADVCTSGHQSNTATYRYEYDHACQNVG